VNPEIVGVTVSVEFVEQIGVMLYGVTGETVGIS